MKTLTDAEIEKVREALGAAETGAESMGWNVTQYREALSILSSLESESSPHVVAEPVATESGRQQKSIHESPFVYADKDALDSTRHYGIGKSELSVMRQGRCTVPLYTAPQQTAPVTEAKSLVPEERVRQLEHLLDESGKLADWINEARLVVLDLMAALERRVRSDCTPEQIEQRPWRCSEYVAAEQLLSHKPVAVVEITAAPSPPAAEPPLNTQDGVDERDAKIERLENAMHQIETWAKAYPLAVFPEPDWVKAHEVLQAAGMTIDAISASNMRHVITRVVEIARSNLSKNTEKKG